MIIMNPLQVKHCVKCTVKVYRTVSRAFRFVAPIIVFYYFQARRGSSD